MAKTQETISAREQELQRARAQRNPPPKGKPLPYEEREVVGKFRVLRGIHSEGGMTYGQGQEGGDVVESRSNLLLMNAPGCIKFAAIGKINEEVAAKNTGDRRPTWKPENPQTLSSEDKRELDETGRAPIHTGEGDPRALGSSTHSDDYEQMTVEDLRQHAQEYEIELHGARSKADIIKAIRQADREGSED